MHTMIAYIAEMTDDMNTSHTSHLHIYMECVAHVWCANLVAVGVDAIAVRIAKMRLLLNPLD